MSEEAPSKEPADPNYMQSLARGLDVLEALSRLGTAASVSHLAEATGLSRPVVSRCLHTLERCGYVEARDHRYHVLPHVLSLARSYLSQDTFPALAQPALEQLRDSLGESCSIGMLDGTEIVYVARASAARIMTIALTVGSRLPLHCTSMGRVLLAGMKESDREAFLLRADLTPRTPHSIVDPTLLREAIAKVGVQGYALVEQELELGLRSIAVPVLGADGRVIAALNMGASTSRMSVHDLKTNALGALRECAQAIARFAT